MKKRLLALLLVLAMVFSLMPAALAADTLSGSGTEDDPYLLATAADLKAFRDMANAEASSKLCATLTADIDLGGEAWTPFEPSSGYVSEAYAGTFDGANHTIKGLSVNSLAASSAKRRPAPRSTAALLPELSPLRRKTALQERPVLLAESMPEQSQSRTVQILQR